MSAVKVLTPEERRIQRGNAPGSAILNKRVQKPERSFVSRLGYNTACSAYTQSSDIGRFSGSSLNRLYAQKEKLERQRLFEVAEADAKANCKSDIQGELAKQNQLLRDAIQDKLRNTKRPTKPLVRHTPGFHVLSPRSKGKIRDKCTAFYRSCGKQKTFATLTFLNQVTDRKAQNILNKFLTQLRDDYKRLKYIWVAERQGNGNIHFHLIINQRLPVSEYNALWVLQQYNAGVTYDGIHIDEIKQRYNEGTIGKILNPFDIKNVKTIYGLSFYLTKYITKNTSDGFGCLAWHCSRNVSRLFIKTVVNRSCMRAVSGPINSRVNRKTGEVIQAKMTRGAFHQLYFIENKPYFLKEMVEIEQINAWILDGMIPDKIPSIPEIDIGKFYIN
jgi:hypothetical protein